MAERRRELARAVTGEVRDRERLLKSLGKAVEADAEAIAERWAMAVCEAPETVAIAPHLSDAVLAQARRLYLYAAFALESGVEYPVKEAVGPIIAAAHKARNLDLPLSQCLYAAMLAERVLWDYIQEHMGDYLALEPEAAKLWRDRTSDFLSRATMLFVQAYTEGGRKAEDGRRIAEGGGRKVENGERKADSGRRGTEAEV